MVNTRNLGALSYLANSDVVEVPCRIGREGVTPIGPKARVNDHIIGLTQAVKAYEKLTVKAALTGDRDVALAALITHPLIGDYQKASDALDEMLNANKAWLDIF